MNSSIPWKWAYVLHVVLGLDEVLDPAVVLKYIVLKYINYI